MKFSKIVTTFALTMLFGPTTSEPYNWHGQSLSLKTVFQATGEIFAAINELEKLADEDLNLHKRDILDNILERIFQALKDSGLATEVVRLSLEDDDVRAGVSDLTIQLLEADIIPYYEVFEALKESGLAIQVVQSTLQDPDTMAGALTLAKQLLEAQLPTNSTSL